MKFGIFYEHQLPRPWSGGAEQRLQLVVSSAAGVLWQTEDYGPARDDDPHRLQLLMDSRRLAPGEITVEVTRWHRTTGARIQVETYRVLLR